MITFLFPLLGWLTALSLLAVTLSSASRLVRARGALGDAAHWLTPLLYGCLAIAALTGLGAVRLLTGIALAVLCGGIFAGLLLRGAGKALRTTRGRVVIALLVADHLRGGIRYLRDDARLPLRLRSGPEPRRHEDDVAVPVAVPAPVRDVPAPREAPPADVPSVRDDPALGPVPAPADVAGGLVLTGVPVPPEWAALCEATASWEPDTDEELIMHVAGEAAGVTAYAEAVRARADMLLHGIGLDPAYVQGHLELADEIADLASAVAMVDRRFTVIYEGLRNWVADHPEGMPHKAREWLQGGSASPAEDAGDEAA